VTAADATNPGPAASFESLLRDARVIVCCGTGGVGKTTTSAAIALEAARLGRNAIVVTIDPARRLANTMGIDHLGDDPAEIDQSRWDPARSAAPGGRFSALMLDPKSTFDGLVARYATDEGQAARILDNRFYRNISGVLGGTQEYMAMEKLHSLVDSNAFDLIVVDTPPTRHALDFLDAPNRLIRMLDNRLFRLVMLPTRASMKVAGSAVQALFRRIARVVGAAVIDDVVAFFRAFEGMEAGFRTRAAEVREILTAPTTSFVVVTSPRPDAIAESAYFTQRIAEQQLTVRGIVVNRVHPAFGVTPITALEAQVAAAPTGELAALIRNLITYRHVATRERAAIAALPAALDAVTVFVPFLARDIHDFGGLAAIGSALRQPGSGPAPDAG
jgi:anion-transporting  ArsA/GET3 family ATPase